MDKTVKESKGDQPAEKPVAVRSAKDAINAMYADQEKSGLGDYLAMSAREIVNATDQKKGAEAKSAANLHKHSNNKRMESVRTSASSLVRKAPSRARISTNRTQASDPIAQKTDVSVNIGPEGIESKAPTVVRTSLKLKPKKPTVRIPTNSQARAAGANGIRSPKQPIALNQSRTRVFQDVVRVGGGPKIASSNIKEAQPSIVSQNGEKVNSDAIKKLKEVLDDDTVKVNLSGKNGSGKVGKKPIMRNPGIHLKKTVAEQPVDPEKPVLKMGTSRTHTSKINPIDSIKKKFAPAPKGFAASNSRDARPDRPYQVEDYLNPSHATKTVPATDDATHYYGLSEDELSGNAKGVQVNRDEMAAEAGLGMIEDYDAGDLTNGDEQATKLRRDAPDNNKYALNSQSPYYLKPAKEMKKRPLSGNGVLRAQMETATSVNAGMDLEEELPKKNQYKKNSKKSKKSKEVVEKKSKRAPRDINQPTVIIPSHHRSSAPMVALLLLTVILGATVGALAYLFFFQ